MRRGHCRDQSKMSGATRVVTTCTAVGKRDTIASIEDPLADATPVFDGLVSAYASVCVARLLRLPVELATVARIDDDDREYRVLDTV